MVNPQPTPYKAADVEAYDFGPWVETASSRCTRYRYDYANSVLQVEWRNGRGHVVTAYRDVSSEMYRRFARSASKGKFVNRVLNGSAGSYDAIGHNEEFAAPSNPNRRAVKHRPE